MKVHFRAIVLALTVFITFIGSSSVASAQSQVKPELNKVTIAVGGKPGLYYLPLTLAEQLGYFKDEGLNVEIIDFAGGTKALQAVVGGSADVASGAFENAINLQARNQKYRAFVLQARVPQIVLAIATSKADNYKSPKDLKGLKIGVSAPGSSTSMLLNYVLAQNGLKPTDVSTIGVGVSSGALSALRMGTIDAISNIDPVISMLQEKGEIKIIADTRTVKDTQAIFGGLMPAASLYASQEFIDKNPKTVQALTNAMVRTLKWLKKAGPSEIIKTVPEAYLLGDRSLYLAAYTNSKEAFSLDGLFSASAVQVALKAVSSFNQDVHADKINLSDTYTNDFVVKANQKYRD